MEDRSLSNRRVLLLMLALLAACSAGTSSEHATSGPVSQAGLETAQSKPPSAAAHEKPEVTGVWRGESSAECATLIPDPSRCGAVNDITLTLLQEGAKVSGLYKCSYGNMDCRNSNDSGKVAQGTMGTSLLQLRVMMPDGSDCIFNGHVRRDRIEGGYLCLQGGGLVERGIWRASRSY